MQELAHGGQEYLGLVAVHPVAGPLDRDQLDPGEQGPHRRRVRGWT